VPTPSRLKTINGSVNTIGPNENQVIPDSASGTVASGALTVAVSVDVPVDVSGSVSVDMGTCRSDGGGEPNEGVHLLVEGLHENLRIGDDTGIRLDAATRERQRRY
jgi:hypothetical protein